MFVRPRDLVCQRAVDLVTDYIEGALSRADRRRFESHLASCQHCYEYLAQMRVTIQLSGRLQPAEMPPEMRDDLVALYRQWQADAR
jgi:anti-sigma factor RsiW